MHVKIANIFQFNMPWRGACYSRHLANALW